MICFDLAANLKITAKPVAGGAVKVFVKLTGKHLYWSLRPATLLKKRLQHRYFPVNFAKFLRTPLFIERRRCFCQW